MLAPDVRQMKRASVIEANIGMVSMYGAELDSLLMLRDDQELTPDGLLVKKVERFGETSGLSASDLESPAGIPGIVRTRRFILDHQLEEHRECCASELFDAVACMGGMELTQGLEWCSQMVRAAAQCHAHGLSHGQLRPEHALLDGEGAVKLLGFEPLRWRQCRRGASIGDEHALRPVHRLDAPELLGRSHATLAELQGADVWALGVLTAAILAGEPPHLLGDGSIELPGALQTAPAAVTLLLASMMSKAPADRPSLSKVEAALRALSGRKGQDATGDSVSIYDSMPGRLAMARTDSGLSELSDAPTRNSSLRDLQPGVALRPARSTHLDALYDKLRMLECMTEEKHASGADTAPL